jgi:hypothetical protein
MSYLFKKKKNAFLYYVRKQVMSVVHNVNHSIRIEQKKRIYAISSKVFLT